MWTTYNRHKPKQNRFQVIKQLTDALDNANQQIELLNIQLNESRKQIDEVRRRLTEAQRQIDRERRRSDNYCQEMWQAKSDLMRARQRADDAERRIRFSEGRVRNIYSVPEWIKLNLKFLIFACHPDRNQGKIEAGEVTKELLKLR